MNLRVIFSMQWPLYEKITCNFENSSCVNFNSMACEPYLTVFWFNHNTKEVLPAQRNKIRWEVFSSAKSTSSNTWQYYSERIVVWEKKMNPAESY